MIDAHWCQVQRILAIRLDNLGDVRLREKCEQLVASLRPLIAALEQEKDA